MHEIAEKQPNRKLTYVDLQTATRGTTNIGVLLELGKILLKIYAVKLAVKNWE